MSLLMKSMFPAADRQDTNILYTIWLHKNFISVYTNYNTVRFDAYVLYLLFPAGVRMQDTNLIAWLL